MGSTPKSRILVTGGAGYIGAVCAEELMRKGYSVTVIDDLSTGHSANVPKGVEFHCMGISNAAAVRGLLNSRAFDAVFHFAARALVGESMANPAAYYYTNVCAAATFLDLVKDAGIRKFIFSSSCSVYGDHSSSPIYEDHPKRPLNPYGETKLAFEKMLEWYSKAYDMSVCCFRYFNAAGATDKHGEDHKPETHIIPLLLEVAAGERESFTINGTDYPTPDGTCVRDYVHVLDISQAHILGLQSLESPRFSVYNIGSGEGFSILQVVAVVEAVTGRSVRVQYGPRREGDPATLYASPRKLASELGWKRQHSYLERIIETAWKWKTRKK